MKNKIRLFALILMLSSAAFTAPASAKEANIEKKEMRVMEIKNRVEEIKSMDFSKLDKVQRQDIRHELKDMNKELRQIGPGIYISVGALIIIILLLILIL